MSGYAFFAFVALSGLIYGYTQWTLGHAPWGFTAVPVAALLALILYLSAFFGQRLGDEQMHQLKAFLDDAIDIPSARS